MAAITFNPATMATGDATIDTQHRQLISIVNDILDAMAHGQGKDAIGPALTKLGAYTRTHFSYEEACMNRFRCPVAAANQQAHADFLGVFTSFSAEFTQTGPTSVLALKLKTAVGDWLRNHIVMTDTKLRPCIVEQRGRAS
jgi:hemerythrin